MTVGPQFWATLADIDPARLVGEASAANGAGGRALPAAAGPTTFAATLSHDGGGGSVSHDGGGGSAPDAAAARPATGQPSHHMPESRLLRCRWPVEAPGRPRPVAADNPSSVPWA